MDNQCPHMGRYKKKTYGRCASDQRFYCELVLLETSADNAAKEVFWRNVATAARNTNTYLNPRFLYGERFCSVRSTTLGTGGVTCTIFVDFKASALVICFPGTNHLDQLLTIATLRATQLPWSSTGRKRRAQKGFLTIYHQIGDAVLHHLTEAVALYPTYNFVIAGYSLGGALCRLLLWHLTSCAAHFLIDADGRPRRIEIITWGAPRVFDATAAAYYSDRILSKTVSDTRYEMPGDRIVGLPPACAGFQHVGDLRVMDPPLVTERIPGETRFERLFAGVHQSYLPNMRFVLAGILSAIKPMLCVIILIFMKLY